MVYFIIVVAGLLIVTSWCIVTCPQKQNDMDLFLHQSNTSFPIFHLTGPDDTYTESYAEVAQEMSN